MSKRKSKCEQHINEIINMINSGKNNVEIAESLRLSIPTVSIFIQRNLGGNKNYIKKKTKHAHLHKEILTYFLNHTREETQDNFNLTKSEFRSCMTLAYRKKELSHIRKDKRLHSPWTNNQLLFLLKYSGVISRNEISKYLKRGASEIVIKERLQKLKVCSKSLNGIRHSQFLNIFSCEPGYIIETTAGSGGRGGGNFKLVPWCYIDELIVSGKINCSDSLKIYFSAMAMFQKWIHGENYWVSLTLGTNKRI